MAFVIGDSVFTAGLQEQDLEFLLYLQTDEEISYIYFNVLPTH